MRTNLHKKVVYLLGAGASHGCVSRAYRGPGILMGHLTEPLLERLRAIVTCEFSGHQSLNDLVNQALSRDTDFEHVITFLNDSPSKIHRQVSERLREVFYEVLDARLKEIEDEVGEEPVDLYTALLDMYQVPGFPETLGGLITLNYDNYIENAVQQVTGQSVDFGISVNGINPPSGPIKLLKLHGSFGWSDASPIVLCNGGDPLWIPPGIQKEKQTYPFNVLWGQAREMLSCDVLRIVGCRLGANDWDLISLLFSTCHVSSDYRPYAIEIIDSPVNALRIEEEFPYLGVRSLLEAGRVGDKITAELTGNRYKEFLEIDPTQKVHVFRAIDKNRNWFQFWLRHMAEQATEDLDSIETANGYFERILEGA